MIDCLGTIPPGRALELVVGDAGEVDGDGDGWSLLIVEVDALAWLASAHDGCSSVSPPAVALSSGGGFSSCTNELSYQAVSIHSTIWSVARGNIA